MCRWITFISTHEISLLDLVLTPSNSLVEQSIDASYHPGFSSRYNHIVNADGFGVGWYHVHSTIPACFKGTEPAWSNVNLREICTATKSSCVVAHVRAASPGSGVSLPNVHPFKAGRLLFCHNGAIQGFSLIRRKMMNDLTNEAFLGIQGTTDSECVFGILLSYLANDESGEPSPYTQTKPFGSDRLYAALKNTIRQIERMVKEAGIRDSIENPTRCNFSLSDGETVVCSRFCDKYPEIAPPSLYYAFGEAELLNRELIAEEVAQDGGAESGLEDDSMHGSDDHLVDLGRRASLPGRLLNEIDPKSCSFVVASDPLTKRSSVITWHHVPANSVLCYTRGSVPKLYKLKVLDLDS